jgi:hypothetical protein
VLAIGLVTAILCAPCTAAADPAKPWSSDMAILRNAIHGRDWTSGDSAARRLSGIPGLAATLVGYWIYERGSCEEAVPLLPSLPKGSLHDSELRFDTQVCLAARMERHDGLEADRILGAAIDATGSLDFVTVGAWDRFAQANTVDAISLNYSYRKGLGRGWNSSRGLGMYFQVLNLEAENIRKLLAAGADANAPMNEAGELPLQVVRKASLKDEAKSMEVARVLLDGGADPAMLSWFGAKTPTESMEPGSMALESMLADAAGHLDPVRVDVVGVATIHSDGNDYSSEQLRVRVGNASKQPVRLRAWRAGDYLLCSLHVSQIEYQPPLATSWKRSVASIEDGTSSGVVEVASGTSREILCDSSQPVGPPGSRYRLQLYFEGGGSRYSAPFLLDRPYANWVRVELPRFQKWH